MSVSDAVGRRGHATSRPAVTNFPSLFWTEPILDVVLEGVDQLDVADAAGGAP